MSELSAAAAVALGVPEAIVQRSAAARAEETGMTVDEVLSAWAGGGAIATTAPPAAEEAPAAGAEPAADQATEETPAEEAAPGPPAADQAAGETPTGPPGEQGDIARPAAVTRSPIPAQVTAAEAAGLPEVITVPTAGIRERTNFVIPRWLAAVMLIIPAFALFALGGSATGECGEATELDTNVITGEVVNCDGTEFTGSGVGGGGADFIAMGQAIYDAAPGNCTGCHGANGGGSGVIPGLTGVLTTFGACTDHIAWVALGSAGFRAAGDSTYGDTNKPINDGMPAFEANLSAEQLASVAAFERVRFGGADPAETLVECGLAPDEGEEGGEGGVPSEEAPGEEGPSEEGTTTTVSGAEAGVGRTP